MTAEEWEPTPAEEQALAALAAATQIGMPANLQAGEGVSLILRVDGSHQALVRHEPSMWLRKLMNPVLARINDGDLPSCPHPDPVKNVLLFRPDRIMCTGCLLGRAYADDPADGLGDCSRCGAPHEVWLGMLANASLILQIILCEACAAMELI